MNIPFTIEQFFELFTRYNQSVWPAQAVLILLAVAALFVIRGRYAFAGRGVSAVLALLWFWTGIVYHLLFFTSINPAAFAFGTLCILQALLFLVDGAVRNTFTFRVGRDAGTVLGLLLIAYALVVYPLLGWLFGHGYPAAPTFGAPCPTTIYTFGILLLGGATVPLRVYIIPALWALIGFNAALRFGVYEDYGLLISAIIAVAAATVIRRKQKLSNPNKEPGTGK